MSVSLKWEKTWITQYVTSVRWSGSAAQCSRFLEFSVLTNPYDKSFKEHKIKLGDIIYLYVDKKRVFVGKVTGRDRTGGKEVSHIKQKILCITYLEVRRVGIFGIRLRKQ